MWEPALRLSAPSGNRRSLCPTPVYKQFEGKMRNLKTFLSPHAVWGENEKSLY